METSLIQFQNFIIATRDSGYKSTASALAELVDNALEAAAGRIDIQIRKTGEGKMEEYDLCVIDDGRGMTDGELNQALQFGGSSRFDSRTQLGRYGMGLPNSSLSQCRRVEVTTWQKQGAFLFNYLDVDEIIDRKLTKLPNPQRVQQTFISTNSDSGTIVRWRKCDRLSFKYQKNLLRHVLFELGRIFRYALWRGVKIFVGNEQVLPFDPLFIGTGTNLTGGIIFGKELSYMVKLPNNENKVSEVKVKFVELPVQVWSKLPNNEKRKSLITKCAGVTVLRSEREIDYGWFFMGSKRKENYDDWWRCEVSFQPELDEAFGVTHTKQEIKETEFISSILVPDLEQVARTLHNRVRTKFIELKNSQPNLYSKQQLENADVYLPGLTKSNSKKSSVRNNGKLKGLAYEVVAQELDQDIFFDVIEKNQKIVLKVNKNHIFYHKVFESLHDKKVTSTAEFIKIVEVLMFAAARSEFQFTERREKQIISRFKREWSSNIKSFMS